MVSATTLHRGDANGEAASACAQNASSNGQLYLGPSIEVAISDLSIKRPAQPLPAIDPPCTGDSSSQVRKLVRDRWGWATQQRPRTISTKPNVTMATAAPLDNDRAIRRSIMGFSPMAMNSASPTTTKTLVMSAMPPEDD